jgi:type III pantothenate kinase
MFANLLQRAGTNPESIETVVVACVVPGLTAILANALKTLTGRQPLVVGPGVKTQVPVKVDPPQDVGADQVANVAAAVHKYGAPAVVVDFGTATMFVVVSAAGEYVGGAVAPGITTAADGLYRSAARLPYTELAVPTSVIGRTTTQALQSGLVLGHAAMVEGMLARLAKEIRQKFMVIATGTYCELVTPAVSVFDHIDPDLTLYGLCLIAQRNLREGA